MVVNQQALHGLNISYNTAFNKAFTEVVTHWQEIAMLTRSATGETSYKWLGNFPVMKEWIGEREIQKLAAFGYSIRNRKWENTISVPREDIEDDQYGVYVSQFEMLGESAALHPETLVFGAMKDGFKENCYDAVPFYSANHPYGTDGKQKFSNFSELELSEASFLAARASMMMLKGENGKSLNIIPNLLAVSPANEEKADWLLNADYHNGSSNTLKGKAKVLVSTELSDLPEAWFLLDTRRKLKPIIYQVRKEIKMTALTKDTDENVFMRDEFIWGADGRSNVGYSFWQLAFGSTGTTKSQG